MAKKVLIISTSIRTGSNSEILANAFADGARASGNEVEIVSLRDKTISFCRGCFACQKLGHCVIKDDANEITEKLLGAEVVVWATPIYYYEMCGQMKTMIDRANSLFSRDYQFRDVYLLSVAAENEDYTDEGAVKGLQGWADAGGRTGYAQVDIHADAVAQGTDAVLHRPYRLCQQEGGAQGLEPFPAHQYRRV